MDFKTKRSDLLQQVDSHTELFQSQAFVKWFGSSKVVDENGRPLLVYHGTRRSFDALQISKPRGAPGNPEGIYFTADRRVAEEYAMDVDGAWDEKSRVIAAYIRIESESDGKIIDSSYSGREYVVFGSDNIHVMPKCAPKELG
ncbi:hypothetical protein CL689_02205 [Candidatus Saccharibacteria bacterium]|nr:hypothetical protein [Candidatus Saccharibacteria bacterium]|tara:strand:- start:707 stop:1135 length:429 start_codon:yes stop_codon:yes gene_type:complete